MDLFFFHIQPISLCTELGEYCVGKYRNRTDDFDSALHS